MDTQRRWEKTKYNSTFNIGPDCHLNACVGNNGSQDHWKYGFGYDEAVKVMLEALSKSKMVVDAGVYPLVFCARHRLELFIKDQLLKFEIIRPRNEVTEKILNATHDLGVLWGKFKEQAVKTDRRIISFIEIVGPYISDFSEIDPTGATFRYPYDKSQTLHLEYTPIINIDVFGKRYHELSDLLSDFERLTDYLIDEYQQGTFTKSLSRDDLNDISLALPRISQWSDPSFDDIRYSMKVKYGISSNELSSAINVIKRNREFSANIGVEIPLEQLDSASLKSYIDIYTAYHPYISDTVSLVRNNALSESKLIRKISENLSKDAITAIYTLYELGKLDYFSESYDHLFKRHQEEYDLNFYCSYILRSRKALKFIRRGLEKAAQKMLLSEFVERQALGED